MKKSFPNIRLRRLRSNSPIRNLIRENVLSAHDLIQPIFLIDGKNKTEKIKSMPSIHRMTIDLAIKEIKILQKLGIQGIALFPCIKDKYKDAYGSESYNDDGRFAFAYFVIDWNDKNNKFKTWEDVFDDYPTSYSKLYEKQQEKNTYILAGVDGYGKNVNEFSPIEPLNHFYQTSGLKTIKSIVFSYGTNNNGIIQALRWKLVTTRIYLNQNRTSQQDFSELGAFEFTTIPWPYTAPIISGITKLSRYYDSIENVLFNNQFSDEELSSEAQVYNALINDELGDFIGDVDIEQTRFFSNAYDMDELLMLYESLDDEYNPYYDIYDVETNPNGYWGNEVFYPDFDESCVGLIFISDSSNNNLKRDCLIELNMGDVENDNIIDTSGNKNIGIMIGDYSISKKSTLVPLTREINMKLPETENQDRAI